MRIVFMGTPDFSVPVLEALAAAGHEIACRLLPAATSGRTRQEGSPKSGASAGRSVGFRGASSGVAEDARGAGGFCRAWCRCRGRGGLWADPAASGAGCTGAGVFEHPRQPAAALARGGAHSSGDHGGGCGNRRVHHADGGWTGHWTGVVAQDHRRLEQKKPRHSCMIG